MTDYGQDLLFGTFITPLAQPVQHAVELAIVSEQAGLDLVAFQDHPYQPRFHDTWTLLSYVASRTRQIHVSGNVLNLPLRQPAVLARSAASLDLLSGGRVELGIGAGGFVPSGRSLLNGPPRQWAEDLAEITLTYGITGFLLAADDEPSIGEIFGTAVKRFSLLTQDMISKIVYRSGQVPCQSRYPTDIRFTCQDEKQILLNRAFHRMKML